MRCTPSCWIAGTRIRTWDRPSRASSTRWMTLWLPPSVHMSNNDRSHLQHFALWTIDMSVAEWSQLVQRYWLSGSTVRVSIFQYRAALPLTCNQHVIFFEDCDLCVRQFFSILFCISSSLSVTLSLSLSLYLSLPLSLSLSLSLFLSHTILLSITLIGTAYNSLC